MLNNFEKISYCEYFDWYCNFDMICSTKENDNFYLIILILIEKHQNDYGVIFFAWICAKQRCFLKSVEYDV